MSVRGLLTAGLLAGCAASTSETEVGVRTVYFAPAGKVGVADEITPPGSTAVFFRPTTEWRAYDVAPRELRLRGEEALTFRTADGVEVRLEATVGWRIKPESAPHVRKFVGASTDEVQAVLVDPVARTMLGDALGTLSVDGLADPTLREARGEEARRRLAERLQPEGVDVAGVSVGEYRLAAPYAAPDQARRRAVREAARLAERTAALEAEVAGDLEEVHALAEQALQEAQVDAARRRQEADASYAERRQAAEALRAETARRVDALRIRVQALAGPGGRTLVKRRLVEALREKDLVLVPAGSVNVPTDPDGLVPAREAVSETGDEVSPVGGVEP